MSGPRQRAAENATSLVSMLVTGIWLAAMFTGQEWWLAFMLFGYIVLVPGTALLFGDEDDIEEWRDGDAKGVENNQSRETTEGDSALQQLRERYARGDLTDEQFERKLERLLETETLEDVEETRRPQRVESDREQTEFESEK